jgi:hypothetical protein
MKISSLSKKDTVRKARLRCRKKFLYYFPKGFTDPTYMAWEKNYKMDAHFAFQQQLNREDFRKLIDNRQYNEIALRAVLTETKTNLLFSFEKMALRDAIKTTQGAKAFSVGLYNYIYGSESLQQRFEAFTETIASLPRKQTRVLT